MKSRRQTYGLLTAIIIFLIGFIVYGVYYQLKPAEVTEKVVSVEVKKPKPVNPKLTFSAMGDSIAHLLVVSEAKLANGDYDFTKYFSTIKPYFEKSDVVFCNPEVLSAGPEFGLSGYPTFNAPVEYARDLSKVGCNLINLATNHIGDKSQAAINRTLDEWDKYPILAKAGANKSLEEQATVRYFTKNKLKVAFLAFADFSNQGVESYGLNLYNDRALVNKLMTEARANADLVVVSLHWGVEDQVALSANQLEVGQRFADLGADVIIGTGPHVLQKVSELTRPDGKKTLVWYSLGNILSSQLKNNELTGGVAGFTVEKIGEELIIKDLKFNAAFMGYQWAPADRAAQRLVKRHDLVLNPLADSGPMIESFGTTLEERTNFVHQTIGSELPITITP